MTYLGKAARLTAGLAVAVGIAFAGLAGAAEPEGQDFGRCRRVHQPAAPHESLSVTARLNTGLPSPEST